MSPKKSPLSNKAAFPPVPGPPGRLAGAALLACFLLPGCEYLGPAGAKKLPIPPSLVVKESKHAEEEAPAAGPPENRGATQVEVYPPSGALFGAPDGAPERPGKPFRAKEGKYTLNFDDADVAEVAKTILGDTLKANYVISPKVAGKISLQTTRPLAEEEMIPTLEMLLRANGAVLIHEKGLYRIEPDSAATVDAPAARLGLAGGAVPAGYQLRVVPLRYIGVAEMQKVIEPLMPPKSVVRADESRNLLLLAGTAEELESVLETIRIFDVDFMRGMSVALFPLKNVEAGQVAEELEKLLTISGKGPLTGMFRILPIERLQAILVVTPQPRYLDEVQTWIERLDRYNTAKTGNMHVYYVQNVDALELAKTLSNIFGQQGQGRSRTPGASLAPGLGGSSISGGTGFSDSGGSSFGSSSSGVDSSSSSGFGGSSSSGFGGSSASGMDSSSPSSSSFGSGGTSGSQFGAGASGTGTSGSGFGGASSGSSFGSGAGTGRSSGFGSAGLGGTGQGRGRGTAVADLGNNMKIVADPSNNALIIMAKPQEYRDIESVVKQLDVMPLQVLVDATIVEVALTDELQYGLRWYFQHRSDSGNTVGNAALGSVISGAAAATAAAGGFTYTLLNLGKNFAVELDALAKSGKINVLSAPSLMVLNNQEANIKVGDQVPILTAQALPTQNTTQLVGTQSIQYKDTGVLLSVRPRVNAGGLVTLELSQAVDNVKEGQSAGGIDSPTIAQRKIQSTVAVKNGETIVLGGLIKEEISNTLSGMPLLSQLPWVGSLFSQTGKKLNRTELVVMMTPRVVESAKSAQDITNEFRRRLTGLYEQKPSPTGPVIMDQGVGVVPN